MESVDHSFVALGGPCKIKLCGPDLAQLDEVVTDAVARLSEFERKYSRYLGDSVISRINRSAGLGRKLTVDEETAALLDYAFTCLEQSEGLFDITSGVLRKVWDFGSNRLPDQSDIDQVLPLIGLEKIHWNKPDIELPVAGMELDFGGFGKEYAADLLASLCREQGIGHGLVDLGGDLAVIGPPPDQPSWRVAIRNPRQAESAIATVDLLSGGLASSGDYERCIELDGERYSHILNPKTGWPVNTVAGVTVIADSALVAGTLSTIAMLKGHQQGEPWLAELGVSHLVIDHQLRISGTIAETSGPQPID